MTAISFACVSPHPPIIVPDIGRGREREAQATLDALSQVAGEMHTHAPQTVVLIATHGPLRTDAFGVLAAPVAKGDFAQWKAPQVRLGFDTDLETVAAIHEEASRSDLPLESISRWGDGLDWSCTVPLYHLRSGLEGARSVFLSISFLPPRAHFALGQAVRRALDRLGKPTAIIASADLSHHLSEEGPYGFDPAGPEFDRRLCGAVSAWDVPAVLDMDIDFRERAGDDAVPSISFLMGVLDGLQVRPRVLSYEGPWGVGYMVAAIDILGEGEQAAASGEERDTIADGIVTAPTGEHGGPAEPAEPLHPLVRLAREAVEAWMRHRHSVPADIDPALDLPQRAGAFVSIKTAEGLLRGCMGTIHPSQESLAQEVTRNAIDAATADPRFHPLASDELDGLGYSVDILGPPERVDGAEALDHRRYGVIVQNGHRRGLLLPDLEGVDSVEEQVAVARTKAAILPEEPVQLYRFEVQRLT